MTNKKFIQVSIITAATGSILTIVALKNYSKLTLLNIPNAQANTSIEAQLENTTKWYIQKPLPTSLNPFGECGSPNTQLPVAKYTSLNTQAENEKSTKIIYQEVESLMSKSDWKTIPCNDTGALTYEKAGKYIRLMNPNGDTSVTVYLQYAE